MGLAPSPPRLVSLDAFRGLTIAAMILVNNPGSWSSIYWPLDHAKWHGWTPTDLIFPFFLFMVGMAMNFSRKGTFRQALRRASILFGLGLFMAAYPFFNLLTVRIPGVLQRIALCYLAAWVVRRLLGPLGEAVAASVLVGAYWWLLTAVPVPGFGPPNLDPETNLGAFLDRLLLSGHLWKQSKTWDPEGLLSTIPAVATTLLGSLAGHWIRAPRGGKLKTVALLGAGLALTVAGLAWGRVFPINKNLWTSSYVLLTAGLAAYLFGLVCYVADVVGHQTWARPAVVYGRNAIFVFVASGLLAKTLYLIKLPSAAGTPLSLQAHLHRFLFASWLPPHGASLAFAAANVGCWFLVLLWMDRRGLHLKV
ncbi:MAG TPA: heparan-alpha-glucosaminide N-acetyltransferase domain-containing protein [Vicinamibacteria bacterium]|nr:heparan-alpha-glucosaminide N-acetyltransferase domain-containing protein [Vicinamibacteria bacterium]